MPCEHNCSSAEVRTLAYRSGDKALIHLFETGQDVYIYTAKSMLGEDKWESFGKSEKKGWRKKFKVVFLAVAYRMSAKTLGESLNVPETEAQGYIDALFGQFPDLETFILRNSEYPINHGGYIETELGDTLRCTAWRYLWVDDKRYPGSKKRDGRVMAKLNSAGINYRIQSFSAVSLASGFEHCIQATMEEPDPEKKKLIRNIIVVHDSCENYFDINHLFEIRQFYDENFLKYAKEKYGIFFDYDLEVGLSYGEMLGLKMIDSRNIEVSGTATVLQGLLRKIREESDLEVSLSVPQEEIIPALEMCPAKRFLKDRQPCMDLDESFYKIKLTKLN